MSNSTSCNCELSIESPSAWGEVQRRLPEEWAEPLARTYQKVVALGGKKEPTINRIPDVPFNPKPARYLHLAITGIPKKHYSLELFRAAIAASLWDVVPFKQVSEQSDVLSPIELSYAESAFLDFPSTEFAAVATWSIAKIDLLRHLHMSSISSAKQIQMIRSLESVILALKEDDNTQDYRGTKIWTLLTHAIYQQLNRTNKGYETEIGGIAR